MKSLSEKQYDNIKSSKSADLRYCGFEVRVPSQDPNPDNYQNLTGTFMSKTHL